MEELCKIMRGPRHHNRSTSSLKPALSGQDLALSNLLPSDRILTGCATYVLGVRVMGWGSGFRRGRTSRSVIPSQNIISRLYFDWDPDKSEYPISSCQRAFLILVVLYLEIGLFGVTKSIVRGVWDDPGCQGMVHSVRVAS